MTRMLLGFFPSSNNIITCSILTVLLNNKLNVTLLFIIYVYINRPLTRKIFISSTAAMVRKRPLRRLTVALLTRKCSKIATSGTLPFESQPSFCRCVMTIPYIGRIRVSLLVPLFLLLERATPERCVAARHDWEDAGAVSLRKLPQRITRKA